MAKAAPQQGLTVYLIKAGKVAKEIVPTGGKLSHQDFNVQNQDYRLYTIRSKPSLPKWAEFFPVEVDKTKIGKTTSAGAILLLKVDGLQYALTFGTGRYYVDEKTVEDNFGLKIVLNSVQTVRSIDKNSFDQINARTRTQAGQESPIGLFGIDVEKDLLRAVTGVPTDKTLGNRMSGIDGLTVLVSLKFSDLPEYLRKLYLRYTSNDYKKSDFSFVDQIRAVTDKPLIDLLDADLVTKIQAKPVNLDEVEMILPDVVDFTTVGEFTYKNTQSKLERLNDIGLTTFLTTAEDNHWPIDLDTLKTRSVYSVNSNDEIKPIGRLYRCLWAETVHGGKKYVLSAGKWYCIDEDFLTKVNDFVGNAARYNVNLPEFKHNKGEGAYNKDVAKNVAGFYCFDTKLMHPEKKQRFEFCDLYTEAYGAKDILHVKVGKSSSAMSHLFNQGTVSAETFLEFSECRKELNGKLLPVAMRIADPTAKLDANQYRIVFGVIRPVGSKLPFFARVNLRQAFRILTKWNFNPVLAEIPINATWLKTKNVTKKVAKAAKKKAKS